MPLQLETKSGASFDIQECDDVDGAVIVAATVPAASASEQQQPSTSLRLGPNGRLLRMRVSAGYPAQPPVLLFPEPADAASSHGAQVGRRMSKSMTGTPLGRLNKDVDMCSSVCTVCHQIGAAGPQPPKEPRQTWMSTTAYVEI
jgi:hypothetical protein